MPDQLPLTTDWNEFYSRFGPTTEGIMAAAARMTREQLAELERSYKQESNRLKEQREKALRNAPARRRRVAPNREERERRRRAENHLSEYSRLQREWKEIVNDLTNPLVTEHRPHIGELRVAASIHQEGLELGLYDLPSQGLKQLAEITWVDNDHIEQLENQLAEELTSLAEIDAEINDLRMDQVRASNALSDLPTDTQSPEVNARQIALNNLLDYTRWAIPSKERLRAKYQDKVDELTPIVDDLRIDGTARVDSGIIKQVAENARICFQSNGQFQVIFTESATSTRTGSQYTRGGGYSPIAKDIPTLREAVQWIENRTGMNLAAPEEAPS